MWGTCWHLNHPGNLKHEYQLPGKHSLDVVQWQHYGAPNISALPATAWAAGENHNQNLRLALQWCFAVCNTARQHCSLLTHNRWKKKQCNCCVGMHGDATALKDSPNHCWYCVSTVSLENKNIGIMFWYLKETSLLFPDAIHTTRQTYNWVRHFSHSTPRFPEQRFCFVLSSWHSLLSMWHKIHLFFLLRNFHYAAEHIFCFLQSYNVFLFIYI